MVKRLLSMILSLICLLPLMACSGQDNVKTPVKYYYLRNELQFDTPDGVISPEVREAQGNENNHAQLLRIYLAGPHSNLHHSPFPRNIELVSLLPNDSALTVTLSDNFADLSGRDLTLACVCLGMTAMELTGAQTVNIQTESMPLDGKTSVTIDSTSIQFSDLHEQYTDSTDQS